VLSSAKGDGVFPCMGRLGCLPQRNAH